MRILFLTQTFPLPVDSGGKFRSFCALKALGSRHEVKLLTFVRSEEDVSLIPELRRTCADIDVVPLHRGKGRQLADVLGNLVLGKSFIINRDYRSAMLDAVRKAVAEFAPDVIHVDHLQMAQFVEFGGSYRVVLDNHNVEAMIIKRVSETSENRPMRWYARVEWPKLQRYELEICRRSDLVLTVSEEDKMIFLGLDPTLTNLEYLPVGVDTEHTPPVDRIRGSHNVLSIGTMFWPPNIESMLHFCRDILPLVRTEIADCTVTIAGARPSAAIQALARDPAITVTGYVKDERAVAANCGVFIVPLRSGSGVRVKILNSLAMGLPIVSTSIGAEGLALESGEHLLIADTAADFAQAVVRILRDPELADRLGRNGRRLVCDKYSWESVGDQLLALYDKRLT